MAGLFLWPTLYLWTNLLGYKPCFWTKPLLDQPSCIKKGVFKKIHDFSKKSL